MPLLKIIPALIAPTLIVLGLPALALAQPYPGGSYPGGWQGGWAGGGRAQRVGTQGGAEPSRQIDVETFRSVDAGDQLGKGRIVVGDAPPRPKRDPDDSAIVVTGDPDAKLPVYQSAVIDQLAGKGYDISHYADPAQFVEVTISSDVVIPEEAPHKPISGEMSVGVSNHGSGYGLALAVDLSKPARAIMGTRMDVRIRDKATRRVLWEGYAQGQSRATENGNAGIDDTRMATRLAVALFARFPDGKVVQQADLPPPPSSGGE